MCSFLVWGCSLVHAALNCSLESSGNLLQHGRFTAPLLENRWDTVWCHLLTWFLCSAQIYSFFLLANSILHSLKWKLYSKQTWLSLPLLLKIICFMSEQSWSSGLEKLFSLKETTLHHWVFCMSSCLHPSLVAHQVKPLGSGNLERQRSERAKWFPVS